MPESLTFHRFLVRVGVFGGFNGLAHLVTEQDWAWRLARDRVYFTEPSPWPAKMFSSAIHRSKAFSVEKIAARRP